MLLTAPLRRRGYGTHLLLFLCGALLGMLASGLFEPPAVQAQVPDSGLQLNQILRETQRTNQLLDEILHALRAGTLKVRITDSDKDQGRAVRKAKSKR